MKVRSRASLASGVLRIHWIGFPVVPQVSGKVVHLLVWKRATEVAAAGWREMKEGARGRVRLQAKRPCLGTICNIQAIWNPFSLR